VFVNERGAPFGRMGIARMIERAGEAAKLPFPVHVHMLRHSTGYALAGKGRGEMDKFQQLAEALRVLARTQEPNRVALVEKTIDEYLNDKAGIVRLSLERLCNVIERKEPDRRAFDDWSLAREYIHSRLRRLAWLAASGEGSGEAGICVASRHNKGDD
jgi:alpha-L-fucosidase